jgi:hypothetical protein
VFITPGSNGGLGINVGNAKAWGDDGVDKCDNSFTSAGLHVMGDIWLTGVVHANGGSHTITHRTNVVGFTPEQIGTFAETTGELADVYGADYVPTLERATDAIMKVRHTNALTSKIVGIITASDTFANLGDILCVVANDDQYSIKYEVGQLLVPDVSGLCRIAQEADLMFAMLYQIRLPKITWIMPDHKFVGAFIA